MRAHRDAPGGQTYFARYGQRDITLVKDTSLAFAIGVAEMFSTAKALVASQRSMMPFAISALFYWGFNFLVEIILGRIEKKMD